MRILIADDNQLVRDGVARLLSSKQTWEVCGQATDGESAISKARELLPDVILLDISMPGVNGLDAARSLRQQVPGVKILVMSHHDPAHLLAGALEAGAHGCVDKSRLGVDLVPAIESLGGSSGSQT